MGSTSVRRGNTPLDIETFLFDVLLVAAIVPIWALLGKAKVGSRTSVGAIVALWLGVSVLITSVASLWVDQPASSEAAVANRPVQLTTGDYVGSSACRGCHPHNHATWHDSYHRTMTQVASEESVIGDFNNVHLAGQDLKVRLFKEGGKHLVEMNLNNSPTSSVYPVVMTTGSHHRQAYWLGSSLNDRTLKILPYMYLKAEQRWIPRHSGYITDTCLRERPEMIILESDYDRWSHTCVRCHVTHGRPEAANDGAIDSVNRGPVAQAVEFGISCEACHGPGAAHIKANRVPWRRYQQRLSAGPDPTIVNPTRLPHDRSSQVCGQCHVVMIDRSLAARHKWEQHGDTYRPGDDLMADPIRFVMRGRLDLLPADKPADCPDPAEANSFWSDGMVRASGREFNGLMESACYLRGEMSCLSCHQMHQSRGEDRPRQEWADDQLKLDMLGNGACLQCHQQYSHDDALGQHTHHAADSSGSTCYNCHMPHTTYGILKATRSHQISSPDVATSQQTGRPNACNQCHLDKTLAWTADHLSSWYEIPKPALDEDERHVAASVLWTLRGDAGQRGLMAWSYGWSDAVAASGNDWQAPYLAQLLDDSYDAVRFIAHRSLRRLPAFEDFEYDFVGPASDRVAAQRQAVQIWNGLSKSPRPGSAAVLIDAEGQLRDEVFQRLWQQRDDRPMRINE